MGVLSLKGPTERAAEWVADGRTWLGMGEQKSRIITVKQSAANKLYRREPSVLIITNLRALQSLRQKD